jgi:WD40 repeat protein
VLAVSSSSRTIRIYDLRDTSRAQQQTQTRCVQGLCVDPSNDWRLAAYADTSLVVYDRRNMTAKPVFSVVNLSEPIVRIQWDPVRANILTCATRNSAVIRNYHLMQTPSTPAADDGEYHHLDTHITVCAPTRKWVLEQL